MPDNDHPIAARVKRFLEMLPPGVARGRGQRAHGRGGGRGSSGRRDLRGP